MKEFSCLLSTEVECTKTKKGIVFILNGISCVTELHCHVLGPTTEPQIQPWLLDRTEEFSSGKNLEMVGWKVTGWRVRLPVLPWKQPVPAFRYCEMSDSCSVFCLCYSTTAHVLQVLDGRGAGCWSKWRLRCSLRPRKHFQGVGRCRMRRREQEMDLWKSTRDLELMSLPPGNGGLWLHLLFTTPHYHLHSKI